MNPTPRLLTLPLATRYALTAMGYLGSRRDRGFCLVGELARATALPKSFLAKVLQRLARAKLLDSRRGPQGGYRLELDPAKVSLADIVRHAAPPSDGACMVEARPCDKKQPCLMHVEIDACETLMWNRFLSAKVSDLAGSFRARVVLSAALAAAQILGAAALAVPASADDEAANDFRQNCFSCHTIGGGGLTGPDLKDVAKRRSRTWILRFIQGPKKMIDSGDADAVRLRDEARGVVMPDISGMTQARAEALLALVDAQSKAEKSRFKGLSLIDRPLTPADAAAGRALFTGARRLNNGAPACFSCHSIGGPDPGLGGLGGAFGGGALGPDLTEAVSRLGGDKALAAWLMAPVTPVMRPVFKRRPLTESEIVPLVAYLKDAVEHGKPTGTQSRLPFLIAGISGGVFLMIGFDSVWRGRLRSVRRRMVAGSRAPEDRDG